MLPEASFYLAFEMCYQLGNYDWKTLKFSIKASKINTMKNQNCPCYLEGCSVDERVFQWLRRNTVTVMCKHYFHCYDQDDASEEKQ